MQRLTVLLSLLLALAVPAAAAGPAGEAASSPDQDFVLPQPVEPLPEPLATAVAGVGAPALAAHIRVLASPSLEGRGLGDRGLDAAIEYVAASLSLAGIAAPGGGDPAAGAAAHFQVVPLREITNQQGAVTVERRGGDTSSSRTFAVGVDCLLPYMAPQSITAPVVFAGYGIREPDLGHDDYRGLDVRGRIVLLFAGLPAGPEWEDREAPDALERRGHRQPLRRQARAGARPRRRRGAGHRARGLEREAGGRSARPCAASSCPSMPRRAPPKGRRWRSARSRWPRRCSAPSAVTGSAVPAVPHGLLPGVTATISASGE